MNASKTSTLKSATIAAALIAGTLSATGSTPLAARYNAFGFDLFSKLTASDKGNVVVSPTSVALALSMAQNGAAGKTRADIAHVLHLNEFSDAQVNSAASDLMSDIPSASNDLQFSIANSLWVKNGFPVNAAFEREMQTSYHAKVANIPFNAAGLAQLNGWVKEQTLGLIPKILDDFNSLDSAVLANALALKAKWLQPFDPHATRPAPFYSRNGAAHSISMMHQGAAFEYAQGHDWQLVRLPYRGNRYAMYIFLPAKGAEVGLSNAAFDHARSQLSSTMLQLQVPRFTVNYRTSLNAPLSALGMGLAFSNKADFSRLTPTPVHISRVEHVTYVRVDEEGTQAAAVTA
ncbi:MAG: serpin family protein, partial [Candidatus Eremiobacteraeota bacterium]|nr:serpin family protein [Candidatus Eremiobacteraeota bacterium]